MNKHFCTAVPARRISSNGRLELRVASESGDFVQIRGILPEGQTVDCGQFSIEKNLVLNKVYPCLKRLSGSFLLQVDFMKSDILLETWEQSYEIISSEVHSSCLLDGCWVSICHWSDDEARHFNPALKSMTDKDWKQHMYSMHKAGVTSVLIQNVFDSSHYVGQHQMTADSYDGQAFYPSRLFEKRFPLTAADPLEAILTAADECGMAVFPGVGLYAWFDFSQESLKWHMAVAKELDERYGHHPSFYGWYISEEIFGALYFEYPQVPDEKYKDVARFFQSFKQFAHKLTPTKPIALAPNNIHMHHYREQWRKILVNLDIMIPFAFARSENNIAEIAQMCRKTGTHFWVDMEIFKFPFDEGLRPKEFEALVAEIRCYDMLEQVYGYQFTGLMNEPGHRMGLGLEETEVLYEKYLAYYQEKRGTV